MYCLLCVLFLLPNCMSNHSKQTEKAENNNPAINSPLIENEPINGTALFINSLDIRLALIDSIFIGSPKKIKMKLINNSDYKILTGNPYYIKRLEFGFWTPMPEFEKIIWTDEGFEIEAKAERTFNANLDFLDLNLIEGNYRLEKEIYIIDTEVKTKFDSKYSIIGNRILNAEFIIK